MKSLFNGVGIARTALLLALAIAMPMLVTTTDVAAQEITGSVEGTILNPDGTAAAGTSRDNYRCS